MNLLLGVSGGIAAYRACELVSLAVKAGHAVQVVMSANATRFVGPITFEALSGRPVLTDTFDPAFPGRDGAPAAMAHITLAKWADLAIVAPVSANTLAKLAFGLADDALTTTLLALPHGRRVVLAPAMNTEMWLNPATQRNVHMLQELGRFEIVGPAEKRLACGDVGPGGMAEPADLLAWVSTEHLPGAPTTQP
jgi:phosphopantothenoylcysteine decarboxylase/phosphopantothenate--cysteine ligase